jgi:hypothetical protein
MTPRAYVVRSDSPRGRVEASDVAFGDALDVCDRLAAGGRSGWIYTFDSDRLVLGPTFNIPRSLRGRPMREEIV